MMRSLRPCKTGCISESLDWQLNMYALAAGAAGVSLLALAQPAEAKIVYTPAHRVIGENAYYGIDFNHDGIAEVGIRNSAYAFSGVSVNVVRAAPSTAENVGIIDVYQSSWPGTFLFPALRQGARIGHGAAFVYSKGVMVGQCIHGTNDSAPPCDSHPYHAQGAWANVKNRYLGVTFTAHGKTHYGWARLTVELSRIPFKATAILTGYAYETIPGKAIIAGATKGPDDIEATASPKSRTPEPATLGTLALGAPGLSIWRREESVFAASRPNKF